jgi:hypothetical protein
MIALHPNIYVGFRTEPGNTKFQIRLRVTTAGSKSSMPNKSG